MLNDSWAGQNPPRVVVPIEEEEEEVEEEDNSTHNSVYSKLSRQPKSHGVYTQHEKNCHNFTNRVGQK